MRARESGDIRILNLGDREEAYSIGSSVVPIRYNSDGTELLPLSEDSIDFLDAITGSLKNQISLSFRLHELDPILSKVRLAASEDWLAILDNDSNVRVISLVDGVERFTRKVHGATTLALSVNGKRLATAASDSDGNKHSVEIWEVESNESLGSVDAHSRKITNLKFSPDGTRLASWSLDSTIGIWDFESDKNWSLKGGKRGAVGGSFSPDGKTLVSVNSDRTVKLWQLKTGR
ncbi:hypothetical protein N8766_06345, partial [bacterium]|nr:hypothetical protein [bacterium]